jgi:hypothetical protein
MSDRRDERTDTSRRGLLTALGTVAVGSLAGCTGGDGGSGDGSTTVAATTTDRVGSTTTTADDTTTVRTETTTTTTSTSASSGFEPSAHTAALEEAGSYTIELTIEGATGGADSGVGRYDGVQKVIVDTGERYSDVEISSESGSLDTAYYSPPNSDTYYQNVQGQTREVSSSQVLVVDYANLGTGTTATEWPEVTRDGTGSTELGSAVKYSIDSVDDLPESTTSAYEDIRSAEFTVWVDQATGAIARYEYRITYMRRGSEQTVRMSIELVDLGSTTIEKPGWAP